MCLEKQSDGKGQEIQNIKEQKQSVNIKNIFHPGWISQNALHFISLYFLSNLNQNQHSFLSRTVERVITWLSLSDTHTHSNM